MGQMKDAAARGEAPKDRPPSIGHNQPPPDDPLRAYLEDLAEGLAPTLEQLNKLVSTYKPKYDTERPTLADNAQACKAVEMALFLRDLLTTVEAQVKSHRKPLDDMSDLMKTNGEAWTEPGAAFEQEMRDRLFAYINEHGEVRTEYGSLAFMQNPWRFEITDPDKVPLSLCSPDEGLIKEMIKGRDPNSDPPEVPGVRFFRKPILVLKDGKS